MEAAREAITSSRSIFEISGHMQNSFLGCFRPLAKNHRTNASDRGRTTKVPSTHPINVE
jgi:hypothetical protein